MNKFDVILADPPWKYSAGGAESREFAAPYELMTLDEIKKLPVKDIAKPNSALFLWVVEWINPKEIIDIMENWGFDYRTRAWVWTKSNPSGFGFWSGLGYYTRSNCEDCWLGIRGNFPAVGRDVLGLIYAPRLEHSRKPDEQYSKIERLYPNMKYCELFARNKREGWSSWGNEIVSDFDL